MFGILQKIPALISAQSAPWNLSRLVRGDMICLQGWVRSLGGAFRIAFCMTFRITFHITLVGILFSASVILMPPAFAQTAAPAGTAKTAAPAGTAKTAAPAGTANIETNTTANPNSNSKGPNNASAKTQANAAGTTPSRAASTTNDSRTIAPPAPANDQLAPANDQLASPDATEPAGNDFYNDPFAPPEETTPPPSFLMLWLRLMGILLIFVLIAVGILRWTKSRQRQQSQTHPLFQEVANFPLGLNQKIKIVKVIQDYYVIAIAGDNITLLRRLDDKLSLDELKLFAAEGGLEPSTPFFGELLQRYIPMTGVNTSRANQKSKVSKNPFTITRNLRDRVRRL